MTSFNGKIYVSETCHKHRSNKLMPCQAVCNKMKIDPVPIELFVYENSSNNTWERGVFKKYWE